MNKAVFLGAVLLLLSSAIRAETIILNLEEPKADATYTGISNLRGWAVAESGVAAIEIDIDGVYAFDVPMGGTRVDVASAYPDFPDAKTSGFSMAFNYKGLAPGEYLFTARVISNDGGVALQTAEVTVDRFVSSFIDDAAKVDTTTVSEVLFAESTVTLKGVSVEGQEWDVALGFDTATQGFEVTGITAVGAPGGGAACAASDWTSGDYTFEQQGVERAFRVRMPANYDSALSYPLIVAFHGWGGDQGEFLDNATVQSESDRRGYIVVAPLGLGNEAPDNRLSSWSFQGSTTGLDGDGVNPSVPGDSRDICDDDNTADYVYPSCEGTAENGCSWTQCTVDDVSFASALVAKVSENVCIDANRVFAVGGSNGGMFVWDLGRHAASAAVFKAVAAIIGLPHRGFLDPPVSEGGMPAISVTGVRDRTVPPGDWDQDTYTTTSDGDVFYYTGASAITRVWAEAQGCDTTVPAASFDVGAPEFDCRGWSYCQSESNWPPVLDCRSDRGHMYGLGQSWPLILEFFDQL